MIEIQEAIKNHAAEIANLIMMAMTDDSVCISVGMATAGFKSVNDNHWGGHPMKHLVL
jgi:hypothetical protein